MPVQVYRYYNKYFRLSLPLGGWARKNGRLLTFKTEKSALNYAKKNPELIWQKDKVWLKETYRNLKRLTK
jgi:hypothetical protein